MAFDDDRPVLHNNEVMIAFISHARAWEFKCVTDPSGNICFFLFVFACPPHRVAPLLAAYCRGGGVVFPFPHKDSPVSERGSVTSQLIIDMAIFDINLYTLAGPYILIITQPCPCIIPVWVSGCSQW